ncbi:MAG: hypothetical protein JWR21_2465 [Herminiimonas sp.]|nr:hypothetical protein [Herminiimonas sp.]MDB5852244.1 hypothetical protein [Herminiimonas sp.]
MNFAHLVEINDPLNPLIDTLSREQLWRGLVLRVERPKMFVPWLDHCEIVLRSDASIERELRYGDLVIRDQVSFLPQLQVHVHVPKQNDIPASDLNMTIEEPQPGLLFIRFEYEDNSPARSTDDAFYNEFRRSAYQESDIDTVRVIRELAANGVLDAPMC